MKQSKRSDGTVRALFVSTFDASLLAKEKQKRKNSAKRGACFVLTPRDKLVIVVVIPADHKNAPEKFSWAFCFFGLQPG